MRTHQVKLVILAGAILVASTVLLVRHFSLTRYEGRSLGSWLVSLQSVRDAERLKAHEAVQAIGSNAVPTLLRWLDYRPTKGRQWLSAACARLGLTLQDVSEDYYHSKALCGFRALGTGGASAASRLETLAMRDKRADMGVALGYVAPDRARKLATQWMSNTTSRIEVFRGLRVMTELMERDSEISHPVRTP